MGIKFLPEHSSYVGRPYDHDRDRGAQNKKGGPDFKKIAKNIGLTSLAVTVAAAVGYEVKGAMDNTAEHYKLEQGATPALVSGKAEQNQEAAAISSQVNQQNAREAGQVTPPPTATNGEQ